ncbi:hypothetical protein K06A9.1a [Heliothis zea nudivirus]|uniref:Uncharacterized protein orf98 n=1 Tax=Heliothis zea nudivirus 1 TaxID=3116536 RepID=Q8JKL5_9VIRU|nr:hypothetical protein K06A9.1a [Heliothis zea nudivirus]AAN04392.1 hypothetical protein K06A9.1a [Heliothis zea nudivirus]
MKRSANFSMSSSSEDAYADAHPAAKRVNNFNSVGFGDGNGFGKRFDSTQSSTDEDSEIPKPVQPSSKSTNSSTLKSTGSALNPPSQKSLLNPKSIAIQKSTLQKSGIHKSSVHKSVAQKSVAQKSTSPHQKSTTQKSTSPHQKSPLPQKSTNQKSTNQKNALIKSAIESSAKSAGLKSPLNTQDGVKSPQDGSPDSATSTSVKSSNEKSVGAGSASPKSSVSSGSVKSVGSSGSGGSAKSTKSNISAKSTKSNISAKSATSSIGSNGSGKSTPSANNGQSGKNTISGQSVQSGKSTISTQSANSGKSSSLNSNSLNSNTKSSSSGIESNNNAKSAHSASNVKNKSASNTEMVKKDCKEPKQKQPQPKESKPSLAQQPQTQESKSTRKQHQNQPQNQTQKQHQNQPQNQAQKQHQNQTQKQNQTPNQKTLAHIASMTENNPNCEMEYETYFALPVSTHIGECIKKNIARVDLPHREVWVMYFKDNTRVTGTTSQRKHVISKSRHLYLSGTMATPIVIPMCRTVSIEENVPFTASMSDLSSMVQRFVLFRNNNIRISLECRSNGSGNEYYISGEVEYTLDVLNDFHGLRMQEAALVCELRDTLGQYFASNVVSNIMCVLHRLQPATHDSVFKMPCRVFSKFHKVQIRDSKSFIYKHKYDGFKCKLVCTEPNKVLYQDDNIKFIQFNSSIFNTVPNLYFQLENMCTNGRKESQSSSEGIPTVIITDVLGVRLGGQLFMPEPEEVLKFLSTFNRQQQYVNFGDGCKRILVQESIDVNATTKFKRDGLIVIYRNKEFKFKFPTFDVKLMNGMVYVKNSNNMDDSLNLIHYDNMPDGIYEVSFDNLQAGTSSMCNQLTFLRRRTDRLTPSTRAEVEEAMHELDLMIGCVFKLKG